MTRPFRSPLAALLPLFAAALLASPPGQEAQAQCVSFAGEARYASNIYQTTSAIGDFNGDGQPDVVFGEFSESVPGLFLLVGNPNGTFQPGFDIVVPAAQVARTGVAVADFNGDGKDDIAVADSGGGRLFVLLGNGNLTFQAPMTSNVPGQPYNFATADFNGDGNLDVACGLIDGGENGVAVLLGTGTGTFGPATQFAAGGRQFDVAVGDFNVDGKADIAAANYDVGKVSILRGNGNGTFQAPLQYDAGNNAYTLAVGDFNADGQPDVAAHNFSPPFGISVLLSNTLGTFAPRVVYPVVGAIEVMTARDMNADGLLDLVCADYAQHALTVLPGLANGSFAAPVTFGTGRRPTTVAVTDFNNDGRPDVALGTYLGDGVSVLLNTTVGPEVYVNAAATGANDGSSWTNAFTSLQDALAYATLEPCVAEIWVARGTYKPSPPLGQGGSRSASFNLQNNLAIYGGFVGAETSPDQRPPLPTNATDALDPTRATILSGDLNGDDSGSINRGENSHHVVTGGGTDQSAILDGVTIRAGVGSSTDIGSGLSYGGGLWVFFGSPTIRHTVFHNNSGFYGGAAAVGGASQPVFDGCTFSGNAAVRDGGAIYAFNDPDQFPDVTIRDSVFEGNTAQESGGALSCYEATVRVIQCTFRRNVANNGGAIVSRSVSSGLHVINSALIGNVAQQPNGGTGGGVFVEGIGGLGGEVTIAGSVFVGNHAATTGGALGIYDAAITFLNSSVVANHAGTNCGGLRHHSTSKSAVVASSLLWQNTQGGSTPSTRDAELSATGAGTSIVEFTTFTDYSGVPSGTANNGLNPLFLRDPSPGSDGVWGTEDDDYGDLRLSANSPAIDSGDSLAVPADTVDIDDDGNTTEALPLDLLAFPRFVDDPAVANSGNGTPPVDRGCYESQVNCLTCTGIREWRTHSGGDFAFAGNWFPSVPQPAHDTEYDVLSAYTVAFPASTITTNKSASVERGSVIWALPTTSTYNLTTTSSTALRIGNEPFGVAALRVTGVGSISSPGGLFKPTSVSIANDPTAVGTLTVAGAGTRLSITSQSLRVGFQGYGAFNVAGGALATTRDAILGDQPGAYGEALIEAPGSTWTLPLYLTVNNGLLRVRSGGKVKTGFGLFLLQGARLEGDGLVEGPVVNVGTIEPGNSPGALTISGDYTQIGVDANLDNASGELVMDVTGPSPGQYDQLIINDGLAELGGGLLMKAPGDALAVPAVVGDTGSYNIPLLTAAEGINLDSKFDVVFLPRAQTPSPSDPPQFFRLDYTYSPAAQGGGVVRMSNQLLSTALNVENPTAAGAVGTPTAAAAADLDSDGLDDLILTFNGSTPTSNGDVVVMLNRGVAVDGTTWLGYSPAQTLTTGVSPTDIAVFDIDGDGKPDLACSNAGSNSVSLFKNNTITDNGPGRVPDFEIKPAVGVGLGPTGLAIDRFAKGPNAAATGGGGGGGLLSAALRAILVTANPGAGDGAGNISTLGAEPGTFNFIGLPPIVVIPPGMLPFKPRPIDIDNDTRSDIAILAREGSAAIIYPNNSAGTGAADPDFGDPTVIATDPNPIDIGVVVLNDRQGLATLNHVPGASGGTMSVIVNRTEPNPSGSNARVFDIAPAVNLDAGLAPKSLAALDLDSDADDDLAVLTKVDATSTKVRIFRNDYNVGAVNANQQPTLVNDRDVPESSTDALFVLRARLVPGPNPDLITIVAAAGTGGRPAGTAEGGKGAGGAGAALSPIENIRRLRNNTPPPAPAPGCRVEYNLDGSLNPDDLGDYITDYYTVPHVPGPGGYAVPCPGNDPPYTAGYKAAYTPDGSPQCTEPFPDNLGDYITAYYQGC
ncbi:MAG: FG-GAP repeat domain-containing protein [Phycisphaerales bacterium]